MHFTTSVVILTAMAGSATAQKCASLELVYARATTEPPVNITVTTSADAFESAAEKVWSKGYGAAGASLLSNLTQLLPSAVGYPVHYPANSEFNVSSPAGARDMITHLQKMSTACPQTLFALGGHSQGSMVTVAAIPKMSKDVLSKVIAVTMFGGRDCPAEVKDRCKSYCNAGDTVCTPGGKSGQAGPKGAMPPSKDPATLPIPRSPYGPMADVPGMPKSGVPQSKVSKVVPMIPPPPKGVTPSKDNPKSPSGAPASVAPEAVVSFPHALLTALGDPASRMMKRQAKDTKALTCSGPEAEEKGHVPATVKGESAHTAYNKDGYYVYAAACFIYKQYKTKTGLS